MRTPRRTARHARSLPTTNALTLARRNVRETERELAAGRANYMNDEAQRVSPQTATWFRALAWAYAEFAEAE